MCHHHEYDMILRKIQICIIEMKSESSLCEPFMVDQNQFINMDQEYIFEDVSILMATWEWLFEISRSQEMMTIRTIQNQNEHHNKHRSYRSKKRNKQ